MAASAAEGGGGEGQIELSTVMETDVNLPFITANQSGPKHLALTLTRARFEALVEDLLQRTMGPVRQALADAGLHRHRSTRSSSSAG